MLPILADLGSKPHIVPPLHFLMSKWQCCLQTFLVCILGLDGLPMLWKVTADTKPQCTHSMSTVPFALGEGPLQRSSYLLQLPVCPEVLQGIQSYSSSAPLRYFVVLYPLLQVTGIRLVGTDGCLRVRGILKARGSF